MVPVVVFAAIVAASCAAANSPAADTRFARFFQELAKGPWQAVIAPLKAFAGDGTRSGQFGGKSFLTGTAPDALTNGLRTANIILMQHHVAGPNGIGGFDCSSPFTLGSNGMEESKRALDHTSSALLLFGDGVVNTISAIAAHPHQKKIIKINNELADSSDPEIIATLKQQLEEQKTAVKTFLDFQSTTVGVFDFLRWNSGMVSNAVFAGSERG
jgi:hypothetical protein